MTDDDRKQELRIWLRLFAYGTRHFPNGGRRPTSAKAEIPSTGLHVGYLPIATATLASRHSA
jgi:hypothetical protein